MGGPKYRVPLEQFLDVAATARRAHNKDAGRLDAPGDEWFVEVDSETMSLVVVSASGHLTAGYGCRRYQAGRGE